MRTKVTARAWAQWEAQRARQPQISRPWQARCVFSLSLCRQQETFAVTVNDAWTPAVAYCKPLPVAVDLVASVDSDATACANSRTAKHDRKTLRAIRLFLVIARLSGLCGALTDSDPLAFLTPPSASQDIRIGSKNGCGCGVDILMSFFGVWHSSCGPQCQRCTLKQESQIQCKSCDS